MKVRGTIARAAISAGIAASLFLGGMPSVALAAASAGATGTLTINNANHNDTAYRAYQVFSADVHHETQGADAGKDSATHIDWSNNAMKTAVLSFLDSYETEDPADGSSDYEEWLLAKYGVAAAADLPAGVDGSGNVVSAHDLPQNAAEFISERIGFTAAAPGSPTAEGTNTDPRTPQGGSFANKLAGALVNANGLSYTAASDATPFTAEQGYYLFVTDPTTVNANGETSTAPIWFALSDQAQEIDEKTALATIEKKVKDDTDAKAYDNAADANVNEDLAYRLTATLAENFDAFETYKIQFIDTLDSQMTLKGGNTSSVKAYVINKNDQQEDVKTEITNNLIPERNGNITFANGVLTVEVTNVKGNLGNGVHVDKDTKFVVEYEAHLTTGATEGAAGHVNEVYLNYSSDPQVLQSMNRTNSDTAKVFTYKITVNKVDKATRQPLDGAKFQVTTDIDNVTYYVAADGTLSTNVADAAEFVTANGGTFTVRGLDEGVYTFTETEAPAGYETIDAPFTVTIDATKDQSSYTLTNLTASQAGGEADVLANGTSVTVDKDGITSVSASTGEIGSRISNDRKVQMPLTGMSGDQAVLVYGSLGLGLCAALIVRRKIREAQED